MFKDSPDYETKKDMAHDADAYEGDTPDIGDTVDAMLRNNVYVVKVRATEVVPEDQVEPAKYTDSTGVAGDGDPERWTRTGEDEHPGAPASGWPVQL